MKKILAAVLILFVATTFAWGASTVITKPVTLVCAFSAGGGTDQVNRGLAEGMKDYLGVQVNVVNMVGGGGAVAMDQVWGKPRDGLNILGISETGLFVPANGGSKPPRRTGSGIGPAARRAFCWCPWIPSTRPLKSSWTTPRRGRAW